MAVRKMSPTIGLSRRPDAEVELYKKLKAARAAFASHQNQPFFGALAAFASRFTLAAV